MSETFTTEFVDTGAEISNSGMGWCLHYYDNHLEKYGGKLDAADTVDEFPNLTNVYLRLHWAAVEPAERQFDWSVVDAPAQRWIDKGKKLSLRFSCSEHWLDYATPKWVHDAGAKGYYFTPGRLDPNGKFWEPDYNDPIFLDKLERFVEQLALRYDGNPNVDYIDVGSFGVWGEGHNYWSTRLHYDADTVIRHIDLWKRHFRKTLLMGFEGWVDHGRGFRALDHAYEQGLGYRTDSILVMHGDMIYHPQYAQRFWPTRPMTLETQHWGESVRDGVWGDGSGVLQAVEDYHPSWISIHWWPREFLEGARDLIRTVNRRLGYRITPKNINYPQQVTPGQTFCIRSVWRNAGVAPHYAGGHVAYTLKQANGGIVCVMVDTTWNVRELPLGRANDLPTLPVKSQVMPSALLKPGQYELFVSVGDRLGTPTIAMPLVGDDGQKRYRVGRVTVV